MKVWILTGATDTIDTSLISSSLLLNYHKRQEKFACIGIAPWGFIGWKEQLLGESVCRFDKAFPEIHSFGILV